jgi:alginate O-acetyltransferase complex protein AlgI
MIFASFEFAAFFLVVLAARGLARNATAEKWMLLIASCCFYMTWSIPFVALILFMSLSDYAIAERMGRTEDPGARRRMLWLSLFINIGLLAFFKYSNFILANVCDVLRAVGLQVGTLQLNVPMPPAISYFTFAGLSYVLDVYFMRMAPCRSARDYVLFVTFFPKLLSGPITRAREFLPSLAERPRVTAEDVEIGLSYFLIGAVKKLVLADNVASHVNLIFATPLQFDSVTLLLGAIGYTIQIYCDFSGYSDMAIGCARILGYRLPENFQMPFKAASITEFWRRWHITLSTWFRDYFFLPIEMLTRNNPSPLLRVSINMTLTMLLCGLWHGPSWTFVIWGGIHGLALAAHKIWTVRNPLARIKTRPRLMFGWTLLSHGLTLATVVFAMIFFRAPTVGSAFDYVGRMFSGFGQGMRLNSPYILAALACVVAAHLFIQKDRTVAVEMAGKGVAVRVLGYSAVCRQ